MTEEQSVLHQRLFRGTRVLAVCWCVVSQFWKSPDRESLASCPRCSPLTSHSVTSHTEQAADSEPQSLDGASDASSSRPDVLPHLHRWGLLHTSFLRFKSKLLICNFIYLFSPKCVLCVEAFSEMNICYILDSILIIYGIVLTILYCRLRVRYIHVQTRCQPEGLRYWLFSMTLLISMSKRI